MKVTVQTRLSPPVTVYDGSEESSGAGKAIKDFLSPVITVTDDQGNMIYQMGESYESSWFPLIGIGVAGFLVAILIIRRL